MDYVSLSQESLKKKKKKDRNMSSVFNFSEKRGSVIVCLYQHGVFNFSSLNEN